MNDDVGADASTDDGGDSATSGTKNDDTEIAGENVDDGAASTEQQNSDAGQKGEGVAHLKKCSYQKCTQKAHQNWALVACANPTCKKMIHELCFTHFLSVTQLPHPA